MVETAERKMEEERVKFESMFVRDKNDIKMFAGEKSCRF